MEILKNSDVITLALNCLEKFDLDNEEESQGAYSTFQLLENVFELMPDLTENLPSDTLEPSLQTPSKITKLIDWFFKNLKQKRVFDSNRLFMTELLSIILQKPENITHCEEKKYIHIVLLRIAVFF